MEDGKGEKKTRWKQFWSVDCDRGIKEKHINQGTKGWGGGRRERSQFYNWNNSTRTECTFAWTVYQGVQSFNILHTTFGTHCKTLSHANCFCTTATIYNEHGKLIYFLSKTRHFDPINKRPAIWATECVSIIRNQEQCFNIVRPH